jgi:hypothetical protein
LAGNTNAGAAFIWKKDRLYDFAIVEGQEVLDSAINGLLFANNLTASDGVVFCKCLPKGYWERCDFIDTSDAARVNAFGELFASVGRLSDGCYE